MNATNWKLALVAFALLAPALGSAQTICDPPQTTVYPGGYRTQSCQNGRTVAGIGTTLTNAASNKTSFNALDQAAGRACSLQNSNISIFSGGYRAYYTCYDTLGSYKNVTGVGSTATATGINAYGFAELLATYGNACQFNSPPPTTVYEGGLKVTTHCQYPLYGVDGAGSNYSDAAANALGFAELSMQSGRNWTLSSAVRFAGGYTLTFYRSGGPYVSGTGSTMTEAAFDALANASFAN
jgi:hypothetical protein